MVTRDAAPMGLLLARDSEDGTAPGVRPSPPAAWFHSLRCYPQIKPFFETYFVTTIFIIFTFPRVPVLSFQDTTRRNDISLCPLRGVAYCSAYAHGVVQDVLKFGINYPCLGPWGNNFPPESSFTQSQFFNMLKDP